jgi:uroporphyrinogen decarboxylase
VVEWEIDARVARALGCEDAAEVADRFDLDGVAVYPDEERRWIDEDTFIDEWGVAKHTSGEAMPMPISAPLRTPADLLRYAPPDPRAGHHFRSLDEAVGRWGGRKAIFFRCRDSFSIPRYLRGTAEILEDLLLEPPLVEDLVTLSLRYNIAEAREALRRGADVIFLSDDYACTTGPLFSPTCFDRYFRGGLGRIVRAIHEAGGLVVKHTDGNVMPLLDMIVSTGIDALDPIDPLGGMSIAKVRERCPKLPVKGGVSLDLLVQGTPQGVAADALRCLEESGGWGYILSSSNSIISAVAPENFVAMLTAAATWRGSKVSEKEKPQCQAPS